MKRSIAAVIAFLMIAMAVCVNVQGWQVREDESYSVGDIDESTVVNGKDSVVLKSILAGMWESTYNIDAADITADGALDAKDSYLLKSMLAGTMSADELEGTTNVYKLTIGGYDISEFCIVVPEGTTYDDNINFAATNMQEYIRIATGVSLGICYSNEERLSPHAIVYHDVKEDSELGAALGVEGYKYDITNGDLNIYGTRRGNMYCTFVFLERLGFVFYSDDYTYLYESRSIAFEEGENDLFVPRLSYRMVAETFYQAGSERHFFPRYLNGSTLYTNAGTRHGTLTGTHFINAHSFAYYWRMATGVYTDDDHLMDCYNSGVQQPENAYEPNPWQPCASSDSEYETLFLGMRRTMTMIQQWGHVFRKDTSCMSFSICDNQTGYCACRLCRKKEKTEGYSGLYVDLTNRAARDIKEYYPDMKVMTIIYDHTIPNTVRPEENLVVWFCGHGCNNHYFGNSEECGDNPSSLPQWRNAEDEIALKAWSDYCHEAGAEIWYWYYPGTYLAPIAPCPNIPNIYYDMMFVINECNVDGFYYEGGGEIYSFATLKAHMASAILWNPEMTYDEFVLECKEFLRIYYGEGYELIWQYIEMHTEAGNTDNCYLNACDWPNKMYDLDYVASNYEEMRKLITDAIEMNDDYYCIKNLNDLLATCDFIGLCATYDSLYVNGNDEDKELYEARYKEHCSYVRRNGIIYRDGISAPDAREGVVDLWSYTSFNWERK